VKREHGERILGGLITPEQWEVCGPVIDEARRAGLGFALGGGLAFSAYSGMRRNTKDMDFYVVPGDHERMMGILAAHGFEEYTVVEYDPTWSYRGHRQGYIMDLLWRMLNNRAIIDRDWVTRGWEVTVRSIPVKLIPPEELLWSKLYILRRERSDWPDIIGLLAAQAPVMEWEYLLARLGEDAPVLGAVMSLFRWLCPGTAYRLPPWLWERIGLSPVSLPAAQDVDMSRVHLFRGSDWFPFTGG
jgi:hypothetical protein